MSRVIFNLPNNNTVVINDANNNGHLDQNEAVYVNGSRFDLRTSPQGSDAYQYLLRMLGVTDLSQVRNLTVARQIYDNRWSALEAEATGNCERFGELVSSSNTLAIRHGMQSFDSSTFAYLAASLPNYPDGRPALLMEGLLGLMNCSGRSFQASLGFGVNLHGPIDPAPESSFTLRSQNGAPMFPTPYSLSLSVTFMPTVHSPRDLLLVPLMSFLEGSILGGFWAPNFLIEAIRPILNSVEHTSGNFQR